MKALALTLALLTGISVVRAADEAKPVPANSDLKLFEKGADWKFSKNTGDGSFALATDGDKPIGVLTFDFTKKIGEKVAYVLASTTVSIPDTAGEFQMNARSTVAKKITLRFVDSTDQTLQTKTPITASGSWESIKVNLTKKMERWGGANDGVIHFPIKSFVVSIPEPVGDTKSGKIEFADAVTVAK